MTGTPAGLYNIIVLFANLYRFVHDFSRLQHSAIILQGPREYKKEHKFILTNISIL